MNQEANEEIQRLKDEITTMDSAFTELLNRKEQLQAELHKAGEQILEYEQTEAAVCPEDVGVKEYVESVQTKLATAIDALHELYDFQNGPPLLRKAKQWQAAMDKAETIFNGE